MGYELPICGVIGHPLNHKLVYKPHMPSTVDISPINPTQTKLANDLGLAHLESALGQLTTQLRFLVMYDISDYIPIISPFADAYPQFCGSQYAPIFSLYPHCIPII